jgi:hypothetical protein
VVSRATRDQADPLAPPWASPLSFERNPVRGELMMMLRPPAAPFSHGVISNQAALKDQAF